MTATRPTPRLLARGFAPLLVAIVLVVLMILLVPSIAPEHVVVRPGSAPVTTTGPPTTAAP